MSRGLGREIAHGAVFLGGAVLGWKSLGSLWSFLGSRPPRTAENVVDVGVFLMFIVLGVYLMYGAVRTYFWPAQERKAGE